MIPFKCVFANMYEKVKERAAAFCRAAAPSVLKAKVILSNPDLNDHGLLTCQELPVPCRSDRDPDLVRPLSGALLHSHFPLLRAELEHFLRLAFYAHLI